MRYAVISDIHSNLEALEAALSEIDGLKADETVCLGDIVGYNANPNECLDIIRERGIRSVMGNHDSRATGHEYPHGFNPAAAHAVLWTRQTVTEENRRFLRELPKTLDIDERVLAVHGWINDTDSYIFGTYDAGENFKLLNDLKGGERGALCFFGHTHVRVAYVEEHGGAVSNMDNPLILDPSLNYLANPGSVGQPRDNDPRASFLILDVEESEIAFHRVDYDIETTARKVLGAGLPGMLAERLKTGW
jgi:diadenosine tetraphosphatase ApaH/serine/threonine PP2A family protein phosphatase